MLRYSACKRFPPLGNANNLSDIGIDFPIPLSKQEQKTETICQKKYDAYKVKNHTQQALHIVIQKPDNNVLEVLVTATILQNLNREKIIEIIHSAERGLT